MFVQKDEVVIDLKFQDLADSFVAHFIHNRRDVRTTTDLMDVKQGTHESLQSYLDRFMAELNRVEYDDEAIVARIFKDYVSRGISK